jgi:hypothetical protein
MSKKAVHVVPRGGDWAVKTAGASRAAKVTLTQGDAIQKGISMARNQRTELIVHRRDGTIRSKDSYGRDPLPPRDREH